MRRAATLGALWLVAAAVAVAVAWQGVAIVGDQVTDQRPAPLAASEIESRLAETPTTAPATAATRAVPEAATEATTRAEPSTPTSVPAPTTHTTADAAGPTAPPTVTAAPPDTAAAAETRTYNLRGGTVSLRFSPAGVEVLFANPAPGFTVEIEPGNDNGVKVEFDSDSHTSRVDAWWDGGPADRVREDPAG